MFVFSTLSVFIVVHTLVCLCARARARAHNEFWLFYFRSFIRSLRSVLIRQSLAFFRRFVDQIKSYFFHLENVDRFNGFRLLGVVHVVVHTRSFCHPPERERAASTNSNRTAKKRNAAENMILDVIFFFCWLFRRRTKRTRCEHSYKPL